MRARRAPAGLLLAALAACAGPPREAAAPDDGYLRYVGVPVRDGAILLRWPDAKMPLRVHLPPPEEGMASDPEAVLDAVRDGITDWSDVARPGVPSFVFVEAPGDADIPIVWEREPSGNWFIAHCIYEPTVLRLDVARILVTTRYQGREASLDDLYRTLLHEMGHALGLSGHSPSPDDIMYPSLHASRARSLSPGDRATLRALYAKPSGRHLPGARRAD